MSSANTRRGYAYLAAAVAIFAIYLSVLPFELRSVPPDAALSRFARVMSGGHLEHTSRSNYLANALLFVPIGFGVSGALLAGSGARAAPLAIPATLALSIAVSLTAEFLQIYVPGRIVSRTDVLAQTLGCGAGIATWMLAGDRLTSWLRVASDRQQGDRVARALSAYAFIWMFVKLAPFDLTVNPGQLARRVRAGAIALTPFPAGVTTGEFVWDALLNTLGAAPLGALGLVGWTGLGARRHSRAAFAFGAAFVVLVEAAQVFIRSHGAHVTDVLFGMLGVALGVWAARQTLRHRRAVAVLPDRAVSWRALGALLLWTAVLCAYNWRPYDFTLEPDVIKDQLRGISLVPFAGYASGSELNTFRNVLAKVLMAIPFGMIAAAVTNRRPARTAVPTGVWILVAACVFGAIEVGQLLLPSRTPDPTDTLVSIAGACAGLWIGRWLRS